VWPYALAALAATGGLHALAHVSAVPLVTDGPLSRHVGERVRAEVVVQRVRAGDGWAQLDAHHDGTAVRLVVPPRIGLAGVVAGARLVADGSIDSDHGLLTMFVLALEVVATPGEAAETVAVVAAAAPSRAGARTTVAGRVIATGASWSLADDGAALPLSGEPPPAVGTFIAVGRILYRADTASYRLDVEAWRPWTPRS